jgi:hypothetical protein
MIIVDLKHGQLGNQLNLYAHFIALSLETGVAVVNPSFLPYAAMFTGTGEELTRLSQLTSRVLGLAAPKISKVPGMTRWVQMITAPNPRAGMIYLDTPEFKAAARLVPMLVTQGYAFRYRYRSSTQLDFIRNIFTPIAAYQERIKTLFETARGDGDFLIGVSIRQGDYQEHLGGHFYFETEVYVEQMKVAKALFPDKAVRFLVCSNEKQDPAVFEDLPVTLGTEEAVVELYALSRCDLLLGVPSSFVYWASFYGKVPLFRITDGTSPIPSDAIAVMEHF